MGTRTIASLTIRTDLLGWINTSNSVITNAWRGFARETLILRNAFTDSAGVAVDLSGAGLTYQLGIKDPAAPTGSFLVSTTDISDSYTDLANGLIGFTLDFNTNEFIAYVAASTTLKSISVEIIQLDTGVESQILASTVQRGQSDIVQGTESAPVYANTLLHNVADVAAPTVNNDGTEGYAFGSIWLRSLVVYVLRDPSTGAADWDKMVLSTMGTGTDTAIVRNDGTDGATVNESTWLLGDDEAAEIPEIAVDPAVNPAAGSWKLFTKAGGLYIMDDAGVVTGPFGAVGAGDVTGPAASTDEMIARHSGAGGKTLQDYVSNAPTISDAGNITAAGGLDATPIGANTPAAIDATTMDATGNISAGAPAAVTARAHVKGSTNDGSTNALDLEDSDGTTVHDVDTDGNTNLYGGDLDRIATLNLEDHAELTIAGGVVTITQSYNRIDTQADAAADSLDTISGGENGDVVFLRAENVARVVTLVHGSGNISLPNSDNIVLPFSSWLVLTNDGTNWVPATQAVASTLQPEDLPAKVAPASLDFFMMWDAVAKEMVKVDFDNMPGGTGNVSGPASSVDNSIMRWDGTSGKVAQGYTSNAPTLDDTGSMQLFSDVTITGATASGAVQSRMLGANAESTLTIAGGVVTHARTAHAIDTQGAGAADNLDTMTPAGGVAYPFVYLRSVAAARVVTIKHGTGNFDLPGDNDIDLQPDAYLPCWFDGTNWYVLDAPATVTLTAYGSLDKVGTDVTTPGNNAKRANVYFASNTLDRFAANLSFCFALDEAAAANRVNALQTMDLVAQSDGVFEGDGAGLIRAKAAQFDRANNDNLEWASFVGGAGTDGTSEQLITQIAPIKTFLISLWFRQDAQPGAGETRYMFTIQDGVNEYIWLYYDNDGAGNRNLVAGFADFDFTNVTVSKEVNISAAAWHHVAIARTDAAFRLYLDGAEQLGQGTGVGGVDECPNINNTASLLWAGDANELFVTLGTDSTYANSFDGRLEQCAMWKGLHTFQESDIDAVIAALYNAGAGIDFS